MSKQLKILIISILFPLASFADRPILIITIHEDKVYEKITINSKVFYDSNEFEKYKTETEGIHYVNSTKKPIAGNHDITLNDYTFSIYVSIPQQGSGRELNATTTSTVSIMANGIYFFESSNYGRNTQEFVSFNGNMLCRPQSITITSPKNDSPHLKVFSFYTEDDETGQTIEWPWSYGWLHDRALVFLRNFEDMPRPTDIYIFKESDFIVTNNKIGPIRKGMVIKELLTLFPINQCKRKVRLGEFADEAYDDYHISDSAGNLLLILTPEETYNFNSPITFIRFEDPRFEHTEKYLRW